MMSFQRNARRSVEPNTAPIATVVCYWEYVLAGSMFKPIFLFRPTRPPGNPKRGIGYLIYNLASFALYVFLLIESYRQMRRAQGVRRIELQFLTFNSALSCIAAIAINAIGAYLDLRILSRLSPLIVLAFYGHTAWAVTIHRVFDARQVFLSVVQRTGLIVTLTLATYWGWRLFEDSMPSTVALVLCIALCSTFAFWLERKSRDWFSLSSVAEHRRHPPGCARNRPARTRPQQAGDRIRGTAALLVPDQLRRPPLRQRRGLCLGRHRVRQGPLGLHRPLQAGLEHAGEPPTPTPRARSR